MIVVSRYIRYWSLTKNDLFHRQRRQFVTNYGKYSESSRFEIDSKDDSFSSMRHFLLLPEAPPGVDLVGLFPVALGGGPSLSLSFLSSLPSLVASLSLVDMEEEEAVELEVFFDGTEEPEEATAGESVKKMGSIFYIFDRLGKFVCLDQ